MPCSETPACDKTTARVEHADWIDFIGSLDDESIDLLYADPPFNTGQTQRGSRRDSGRPGTTAYNDSFPSTAAWVAWLRQRLEKTLPKLRPTASILLHIDWRTSHHARLLLDDLLGPDRFVNHLIWSYGLGGSSPRRFARKHDDILFYAVDPDRYFFDPPMVCATSNRMKGRLKKATDVLDIPAINNMAAERTGYPTQKPLALLSLLVEACCPADGLVLDPCCGSGTTLVAAVESGRKAVGCDTNPDAVQVAHSRLLRAAGASLRRASPTAPRACARGSHENERESASK